MSAAGRLILLFSGLSVVAYAMSLDTGTHVTDPLGQTQQKGQGSNSASSGKLALSPPEKPFLGEDVQSMPDATQKPAGK